MYFLSDLEHKYLIHKLLSTIREVGVSSELRGWSWHQPPLRPYYEDVKLPMYAVCSKYCPTDRDVYLGNVEKVSGVLNFKMALGKVLHGVVSDCLQSFIQRRYYCIQCFGVTRKGEESPSQPELLTVFQISVLLFLITGRMDYCM